MSDNNSPSRTDIAPWGTGGETHGSGVNTVGGVMSDFFAPMSNLTARLFHALPPTVNPFSYPGKRGELDAAKLNYNTPPTPMATYQTVFTGPQSPTLQNPNAGTPPAQQSVSNT